MSFSLPFAIPALASRTDLQPAEAFESRGALALLKSMAVCLVVGAMFRIIGRRHRGGALYQKEAMAVVGLSWMLATVLGALPFYLSETRTKGSRHDHVH